MCTGLLDDHPDENPDYVPPPSPGAPRDLSLGDHGGENAAGFPSLAFRAPRPVLRGPRLCFSLPSPQGLNTAVVSSSEIWVPSPQSRLCPIAPIPSSLVPPTIFLTDASPTPLSFPGGASGEEPACQRRRRNRHRFHPWGRKIPWRRIWQPTPVFLPGESHGQRSLAGYSPQGRKESDTTEAT